MKYQTTAVLIVAALTCVYAVSELQARGGRGGGGGGGRAAGGGGFNRTPSMSREGRPNQSLQQHANVQNRAVGNRAVDNRAVGNRVGGDFRRPTEQNLQSFLKPTASRDNLHQFMGAGNAPNIGNRAFDGKNFSQLQNTNRLAADRVGNNLKRNNPAINGMFNNDFFRNHGFPYYLAGGAALSRAADWNSMANWLSWGGAAPLYYDDSGYASTVPTTVAQSQQPAVNSTSTNVAQNTAPTNSDWMSLGTYALGEDENQLSNSTMFLQLVLKKDGTIAGTYYNTSTNQTYLIDGIVDQNTQQAAWKLTDNNYTTLMKTGLYNLTQAQTPVTVQFANGTTELWQMVHIQQ